MKYVSVSQINKYRLCPRRWAAEYLLQQREQATESMDLGSRLHTQVEEYLRDEVLPEHPAARRLVMTPGFPTTGLVEVPLSTQSLTVRQGGVRPPVEYNLAGVPLKGFVDVWSPDGVYDHKFTGNARNFITPSKLRQSVQMCIYAHAFMLARGVTSCLIGHNCATFDGRESRCVAVTVTLDEVMAVVEAAEDDVLAMKAIANGFDGSIKDVPDNRKSCYAWGRRCPHEQQHCTERLW